MQSVTFQTHVGSDGILNLSVPLSVSDADVDVIVVVQPVSGQDAKREGLFSTEGQARQTIKDMYGILADDPIERGSQGNFEKRVEFN